MLRNIQITLSLKPCFFSFCHFSYYFHFRSIYFCLSTCLQLFGYLFMSLIFSGQLLNSLWLLIKRPSGSDLGLGIMNSYVSLRTKCIQSVHCLWDLQINYMSLQHLCESYSSCICLFLGSKPVNVCVCVCVCVCVRCIYWGIFFIKCLDILQSLPVFILSSFQRVEDCR